jgi:RNA polymerase subunit RPABC4/transcription elongation factor Spt4
MKVKWKIFRASFPYICKNCGEFSSRQLEYCEVCGKKDSLKKIEKEDYERVIEDSKSDNTQNKAKKFSQKYKNLILRKKRKQGLITILITSCAILIIDIIAFFLILDIANIPMEEIGDNLWVLFLLVGFSIVVLVSVFIATYAAYYHAKYFWWY